MAALRSGEGFTITKRSLIPGLVEVVMHGRTKPTPTGPWGLGEKESIAYNDQYRDSYGYDTRLARALEIIVLEWQRTIIQVVPTSWRVEYVLQNGQPIYYSSPGVYLVFVAPREPVPMVAEPTDGTPTLAELVRARHGCTPMERRALEAISAGISQQRMATWDPIDEVLFPKDPSIPSRPTLAYVASLTDQQLRQFRGVGKKGIATFRALVARLMTP